MSRSTTAFVVAALLSALCAAAAPADTLVVAGKRTVSSTSFSAEAGDIFAPLLPALDPLVAGSSVGSDAIKLITRGGREVIISRDRAEATVDGELRPMPAPPRVSGDTVLLPAKAVGALLGCGVRWDEASRTLYLHPWVRRFAVEELPDRYRVVVAAETPIQQRVTKLDGPPRLVVDLPNTDLADVPRSFAINAGYLQYARIGQNALAPDPAGDLVRLVIGLGEWKQYRVKLSEDRCELQVELPLPDRELPSDAPPVTLLGLGFRRYSPRLAAVTITTSGWARFTSGQTDSPTTVWLEVENAQSKIRMPDPPFKDSVLKEVTVTPVEGKPGVQHLALSLTEKTPYRISARNGQLCIVLGEAELSGLTIVVDAGHGGWDPGAVGRTGLMEKDINLDIALRLQRLLEGTGANVVMTRGDDRSVNGIYNGDTAGRRKELYTRCDIANDLPADLYVAIHCNANGRGGPNSGTETFYRKDDSVGLARALEDEVTKLLGRPNGGAKRHPQSIIVLHGTAMPAALVEVAYISNSIEERLLATQEFRQAAAQGIMNGIARYVQEAGVLPQRQTTPVSQTGGG